MHISPDDRHNVWQRLALIRTLFLLAGITMVLLTMSYGQGAWTAPRVAPDGTISAPIYTAPIEVALGADTYAIFDIGALICLAFAMLLALVAPRRRDDLIAAIAIGCLVLVTFFEPMLNRNQIAGLPWLGAIGLAAALISYAFKHKQFIAHDAPGNTVPTDVMTRARPDQPTSAIASNVTDGHQGTSAAFQRTTNSGVGPAGEA